MWMWAQIERARKFFDITIFHLLFVLTWQHYSENAADKGILMQYVCSVHTSSSPRGGTAKNLLNVLHAGCKHRQYKPISYSVLYAMLTYHGNRIFLQSWFGLRLGCQCHPCKEQDCAGTSINGPDGNVFQGRFARVEFHSECSYSVSYPSADTVQFH